MKNLTVNIQGLDKQPTLVTITRIDEDDRYSPSSCHLFAYTGSIPPQVALANALVDYLLQEDEEGHDAESFDWFDMMGDYGDYADIFANHGLVEVNIPGGMVAFSFDNDHKLTSFIDEG